jgi:hypothetical protein
VTKNHLTLLTPLLVGALAAGAAALDIPLTYERYGDSGGSGGGFRPWGYFMPEKSTKPPAGTWKLPAFVCAKPLYAQVTLGSEQRLLVLDCAKAGDQFYSKLYFDANGNRDLTDDPVLASSDEGRDARYPQFPQIETTVTIKGTATPYSFGVSAYGRDAKPVAEYSEQEFEERVGLYVFAACCYRGTFTLGGVTYKLVLGDSGINGRFDDTARSPKPAPGGRRRPPGD